MNAWTAAGLFILAGLTTVAWMRWTSREPTLDQHIEEALALAASMAPCQCRGQLRDTSGVHHTPRLCTPVRETIGGIR